MSDSDTELVEGVEADESPEPEDDLISIAAPLARNTDNSIAHVLSVQDHPNSQLRNDITDSIELASESESTNGIGISSASGERNGTQSLVQPTVTRDNLLAEDELNFNAVPHVELSGAEWSLEPEDSLNFEPQPSGTSAHAFDLNNSRQTPVDDEAESHRNYRSGIESSSQGEDQSAYHRTESSLQLDHGQAQYMNDIADNHEIVENVDQVDNHQSAVASNEPTDDWEQGSNPEEEDYRLQPEGEFVTDAEVGNEPTEADQGREISGAAACYANDQCVLLPQPAVDGDQTTVYSDLPEKIPTVAAGENTENESEASCNNYDNNIIPNNLNSNSETDFHNAVESEVVNGEVINHMATPEDEINVFVLENQSHQQGTLDSEFFEPECDQSSAEDYQSDESVPVAILDPQHSALSDTEQPTIHASDGKSEDSVVICCDKTESCTNTLADIRNHVVSPAVTADDSEEQTHLETALNSHENTPVVEGIEHTNHLETGSCETEEVEECVSSDTDAETCKADSDRTHIRVDDVGDVVNIDSDDLLYDKENTDVIIDRCKGAIPKKSFEKGKTWKDNTSTTMNNGVSSVPNVEDELLREVDANINGTDSSTPVIASTCNSAILLDRHTDQLDLGKCDQCRRNNVQCSLPSGFHNSDQSHSHDVREVKRQLHQAKQLLLDRECDISRLKDELEERGANYELVLMERDICNKELNRLKQFNSDDLYLPQIKELEYTISQQQSEIKGLKDKLASHDIAAKRAIATLQNEMKLRIDQVTKMYEDANREKDSMVVKFAQAEHKCLEYMKQSERDEARLRDADKEKESKYIQLRAIKEQRKKLNCELDAKNVEMSSTLKELDKQRELVSSVNVRVKWAQNKLKAELEAHKDTKTQMDRMFVKLTETREESEQIRRDCQAMIKTYQESEEVKSNSLDKELKLKESELLVQEQEKTNFELAHVKTQRELEQMATTVRECKKQNATLREQIILLESEKDELNHGKNRYTELKQRHMDEIQELREKVENLVQVKGDFTRAQELIKTLDREIADLKMSNKDLVTDMDACRRRETNKLELTANLSRKNAELQSDNTTLTNKMLGLTSELQNTKLEYHNADSKIAELSEGFANEQKLRRDECQVYNSQLSEKSKAVAELTRKMEDERDDVKTLKRKHGNNVKDLTRQLQQVRRKLDTYEANTNGEKDTTSLGSRTSSNGSLNTVGTDQAGSVVTPTVAIHGQSTPPVNRHLIPEQEYPVVTEQVEIDKQVLIERIVKLQRALARKAEKIEFMDDHISQLVDEIQKKGKVIQHYVLREETGTMTSELMDKSKAEIMKRHSIMGSVYSSHSTDHAMTLELSLEINRKLQAVLEDILLKNITLKESLETLGQEIARLSQENRRLQLHIQGKSRPRSKPSQR